MTADDGEGVAGIGTALVTYPRFDRADPGTGAALTAAGLDLRLAPKTGARSAAEVAGLARDAVAAIASTDPFDATVFAACPDLRIVARAGVGVDSIDMAAATAAGVAVTTTPGANWSTVADHTLALMLAVVRRVPEHDSSMRRGEWNRAAELTGTDLTGAVVGLVGYGNIARLVAARLRGFDAELLAYDPAVAFAQGVELVSLEELLERSEIVSLHVPLNEGTRAIIGAHELARMREGAILVNTSRGGLVDEPALHEALVSGRLRAAALDVFAEEPPVGSDLLGLPGVVLSPHVAGLSLGSIKRMLESATTSVLELLRGEVPSGLVNEEVLAHPRRPAVRGATGRPGSPTAQSPQPPARRQPKEPPCPSPPH